MTKILFIESGSGYGGSSQSLFLLIKYLRLSKVAPIILYKNKGPNIQKISALNYDLKLEKLNPFSLVKGLIKSKVIYCNNELYSHFFNILLSKVFCRICICHMRGIRRFTKRELWISKFVNIYIAVSEACRINLIKQGISQKKILLIYNGIEFDHRIIKEKKTSFNIGVVSRIVPGKGLETFLEAAKSLSKKGTEIKFLIYGEDPQAGKNFQKKLEDQVSRLCLNQHIFFKGWRTDLFGIYSDLEIVICPSELEESFGRTLVEAMSFEKPVIASRVGAHLEIIQDKYNGLLFSAGDAQELCDKIQLLLNDKDLMKRLSINAAKTAKEKFDIQHNVAQIERVIYGVIGV